MGAIEYNKLREPTHGNEYETPDYFFDRLNQEFGFVFDVAANKMNKKLNNGFIYPENCALTNDWPLNGWLWLNPPYKPLKPWIEKCQEQVLRGCKVVVLIPPVNLACKYFTKVRPREIRFVAGRLKFLINKKPMDSNMRDSVVLVYDRPDHSASFVTWINN